VLNNLQAPAQGVSDVDGVPHCGMSSCGAPGNHVRCAPMSSLLRLLHASFAALFLLSVAVQFNDPDPLPWMLLYGAACVLALGAVLGRPSTTGAVALLLLAGLWALSLSPSLGAFVSRDLSTTTFTMKAGDLIEEEARECGGLLFVCLASFLQVMDANARRRRSLSVSASGGLR
jgi:hypothetical protein